MRPLTIAVKPVACRCNLRCRYCYYDLQAPRCKAKADGIMSAETLEMLIERAFDEADRVARDGVGLETSGQPSDSAGNPHLTFSFQGGEPLLAGMSFYRDVIALQRRYNARGIPVRNEIRTNALPMSSALAAFFSEHRFLIGVSLDGERETHDSVRVDTRDRGTYDRALEGINLLEEHGVPYYVFCLVTRRTAERARETFDALAPFRHLQFIPCLDGPEREEFQAEPSYNARFSESAPPSMMGARALTPELYARFLMAAFDGYERAMRRGVPVRVRLFDECVQKLREPSAESAACGMPGGCGQGFLVEPDGGVYPCEPYAVEAWRLGNVYTQSFLEMRQSPTGRAFVQSAHRLSPGCDACDWLALCRDGCRRDRPPRADGKPEPTRFCESYQTFFARAYERLHQIARQAGAGEPSFWV